MSMTERVAGKQMKQPYYSSDKTQRKKKAVYREAC